MKIRGVLVASVLAAAVVLAAAGLLIKRVPQPPMFCDQCVMQREVVEWRLAGRWKLYETSTTSPTPISDLLDEHHACAKHEHRWSSPHYVAESELETAEAPRVRSLGFLNAPRSVSFLRSVFDYTDQKDIDCWRGVAWQPTFASALEPALRFTRFPEDGFATRAEFLAWWQQYAFPLFNHLNEMTVAD